MALLRNSLALAVVLAAGVSQAHADQFDNYIYNYAGRGDSIYLGAGNAKRANMAIQHPTPWPSYVNDTNVQTPATLGIGALEKMFKHYKAGDATSPQTVINVGSTGSN
jgi:hypothetical protein